MNERGQARMRMLFVKGEAVRYISHLDLVRAWERALRRAGLPLAYSKGFNPHPRISIAMPLPVGCTGGREMIDVRFEEPPLFSPEKVAVALRPSLPPGISLLAVERVSADAPALPSLPARAVYRITLIGVAADEVQRRVDRWLARESSPVVRGGGMERRTRRRARSRSYDLRPLVASLIVHDEREQVLLEAVLLRDARGRTGRPDVLIESLGLSSHMFAMHREDILFAGD